MEFARLQQKQKKSILAAKEFARTRNTTPKHYRKVGAIHGTKHFTVPPSHNKLGSSNKNSNSSSNSSSNSNGNIKTGNGHDDEDDSKIEGGEADIDDVFVPFDFNAQENTSNDKNKLGGRVILISGLDKFKESYGIPLTKRMFCDHFERDVMAPFRLDVESTNFISSSKLRVVFTNVDDAMTAVDATKLEINGEFLDLNIKLVADDDPEFNDETDIDMQRFKIIKN